MSFRNNLLSALRSIATNPLRSILTTLGVVIGVASVIAMLALGNGARAAVEATFRSLGSDQVDIRENLVEEDGQWIPAGKPLSYEDGLLLPEHAPLVSRVEMSVNGLAKVRYDRTVLDLVTAGVTDGALRNIAISESVLPANWPEGKPLDEAGFLSQGRFFTFAEALEGASVCVLGYYTAQDLFMGADPLGETIWVNRQPCQVIGVLAELVPKNPEMSIQARNNESLMLPISTAMQQLFETPPSVSIKAFISDESRMDEARSQISDCLRNRHEIIEEADGSYKDDFTLTTRKDVLGMQQEAAKTFSSLLAAMAVVSLVVGGIGIMNVMLVSVTERTREIGVRLAIGAQKGDIIRQFLTESMMICAMGGVIGILIGILAIPIAASFNQGTALLDPGSIPLSFGVSLLTGVTFGLYPAYRASRLDPIEALRYE